MNLIQTIRTRVRDFCKAINKFNWGYQLIIDLVGDKKGDLLRFPKYFE